MRTFVATCAALLALITGCSDRAETAPPAPPAPAVEPDPGTVVRSLLLPDDVIAANKLVKKDEPVEGVQKLIDCPDLASAGQAAAKRRPGSRRPGLGPKAIYRPRSPSTTPSTAVSRART
jgi:hypothetical protein